MAKNALSALKKFRDENDNKKKTAEAEETGYKLRDNYSQLRNNYVNSVNTYNNYFTNDVKLSEYNTAKGYIDNWNNSKIESKTTISVVENIINILKNHTTKLTTQTNEINTNSENITSNYNNYNNIKTAANVDTVEITINNQNEYNSKDNNPFFYKKNYNITINNVGIDIQKYDTDEGKITIATSDYYISGAKEKMNNFKIIIKKKIKYYYANDYTNETETKIPQYLLFKDKTSSLSTENDKPIEKFYKYLKFEYFKHNKWKYDELKKLKTTYEYTFTFHKKVDQINIINVSNTGSSSSSSSSIVFDVKIRDTTTTAATATTTATTTAATATTAAATSQQSVPDEVIYSNLKNMLDNYKHYLTQKEENQEKKMNKNLTIQFMTE